MPGIIDLPAVTFDSTAELPSYAYDGDAGMDLRSAIDATLQPLQRLTVPTGIGIAIPEGYAGLVIPRSGLAAKHGISVVNAPGLIDSGYRGEIKVILVNLNTEHTFNIKAGDRIAQLMVVPYCKARVIPVDQLESSERNSAGFGSSGVR